MENDTTPQSSAIKLLIDVAQAHKDPNGLVAFLAGQIEQIPDGLEELEYAIGGLRSAVSRYTASDSERGDYRCDFCGRPKAQVGILIVSAKGAICDDCAIYALNTICKHPGQLHLRFAFSVFRLLATIGRLGSELLGRASAGSRALAVRIRPRD